MFATTVIDFISMMSNSDYIMVLDGTTKGGAPTLYAGYVPDLRDSTGDYHNAIKERFIHHIQVEREKVWIYTKDVDGVYSFDDFTRRGMMLIDVIQHMDHKEEVVIYDNKDKKIYDGRVEYLIYDENGSLSPLCLKEVNWFESNLNEHNYPCTIIYLNEGDPVI